MRIKNWDKFQHYKKRNPPWVKLHVSMLTSPDWVMLDDASRLLALVCLMVASKFDGEIPASASPAYFKRVAYLDKLPNFKPLIDCGFLIETQADASICEQVQATARPETEQSRAEADTSPRSIPTESPKAATGKYAFESGVIRLNQKDFDEWTLAFSHLDLRAELLSLSEWAANQPKWFHAVSGALAKRNREQKTKAAAGLGPTRDTDPRKWSARDLGIV